MLTEQHGQTLIHLVRQTIEEYLDLPPTYSVNPERLNDPALNVNQAVFGAISGPLKIDAGSLDPVRFTNGLQRSGSNHAGIVDDDVNRSERCLCCRYQFVHLGNVGQVASMGEHPIAQFARPLNNAVGGRGDGDFRPCPLEQPGAGKADPAGTAAPGHQRHLVCQVDGEAHARNVPQPWINLKRLLVIALPKN